jgi:hypothetical protein
MEPSAAKAGWSLARRSSPAFAVSQFDSRDKTEAYDILGTLESGGKDVFRWIDQVRKPTAELEIYRPGVELSEPDRRSPMSPQGYFWRARFDRYIAARHWFS